MKSQADVARQSTGLQLKYCHKLAPFHRPQLGLKIIIRMEKEQCNNKAGCAFSLLLVQFSIILQLLFVMLAFYQKQVRRDISTLHNNVSQQPILYSTTSMEIIIGMM